jgi:hypothetical protein
LAAIDKKKIIDKNKGKWRNKMYKKAFFGFLLVFFGFYSFADDFNHIDIIVEKLLSDMNKSPDIILRENIKSYREGYDSFGALWIRSQDWSLTKIGFSWAFSGNVCYREAHSAQCNERTWDQIINAITRISGEPSMQYEGFAMWPNKNNRLFIATWSKKDGTYTILLQRQNE